MPLSAAFLTAALGTCVLRLERPLLLKRRWCNAADTEISQEMLGNRRGQNPEAGQPLWSLRRQGTAMPFAVLTLDRTSSSKLCPAPTLGAAEDTGGQARTLFPRCSEPEAGKNQYA